MTSKLTGTAKKQAGAIAKKLKDVAAKPTEEGIATQFVGYMLSIPLSFGYDYLYSLAVKKVITNQLAADILKILLPAGIGAVFHIAKLPGGNIVAGTGYGIAIASTIKILISKFGGKDFLKSKLPTAATETAEVGGVQINGVWGVE